MRLFRSIFLFRHPTLYVPFLEWIKIVRENDNTQRIAVKDLWQATAWNAET